MSEIIKVVEDQEYIDELSTINQRVETDGLTPEQYAILIQEAVHKHLTRVGEV